MILIDFSQVMHANLAMNIFVGKNTDAVQPDFLRHMILNTLRAIRMKFKEKDWGEMVLCCDSKDLWRKDIFPHYKANRKKARAESKIDWDKVHGYFDMFTQEIKDNFHYRVVKVDKCEGDDAIAVLVGRFGAAGPLNTGEPLKIISGDEDFLMLQHFGNVSQFDWIKKRELTCQDPERERLVLILRGDSGDGVPNVLSPDNSFVDGIKQKPLREDNLNKMLAAMQEKWASSEYPEELRRNVKRNEALVDLFLVPAEYAAKIMEEFESQGNKPNDKQRLMMYLGSKRLKLLVAQLNEF